MITPRLSIASAAKNIRRQAAYFVPDHLAIETLVTARKRGVKIEIIVPGPNTGLEIVQGASRSRWAALLDAGVLIYEYQPSLCHCKVIIVDDVWVSVGSTNLDNRSFRLNAAANLNIYDAIIAAEQVTVFESDKSASQLMTRADFKNRSMIGKMFDAVAGSCATNSARMVFSQVAKRRQFLVGKGPISRVAAKCYLAVMNLLVLVIVLLLLFGGGGFYFGGPAIGGGGVGLVLLICLIIYLMGGFRARS
jgi:hypothetical protein